MMNAKSALISISKAYFEAMDALVRSEDWLENIYGKGRGSKHIEVALTKSALADLGGIAEIRKSGDVQGLAHPEALDAAFESYAGLRGERARVDGYFPSKNCFWEAKVSKINTVTRAGAQSIYEIGQWAQDLVKLTEIGKFLPEAGLIYSVAAIAKGAVPNADDSDVWLGLFRQKLQVQLYNDLIRDEPELLEDYPNRKRQLRLLIGLVGLDARHFHVIPADKWAIISFNVAPLI